METNLLHKKIHDFIEESLKIQRNGYYCTKSKPNLKKVDNYIESPNSFFVDTDINKFDFSESKSFYTTKYIQELREVLGSPSYFKKSKKNMKTRIQTVLDVLSNKENEWNSRVKRGANHPHIITTLYDPSDYIDYIHPYMFPDREALKSQRAKRKFFPFKVHQFLVNLAECIANDLRKKGLTDGISVFEEISKMSIERVEYMILEDISPKDIYIIIMKTVSIQAKENLFQEFDTETLTTKYITENTLFVEKHRITYKVSLSLGIFFMNTAIYKFSLNSENSESIGKSVLNFFRYTKQDFYGKTWWNFHTDNVHTLVTGLEYTDIFTDIITEFTPKRHPKDKVKSIKKYILPHSLTLEVIRHSQIPRITPPETLTLDSFRDQVKPLALGTQEITVGSKLLDTINISQRKRFTINQSYLHILNSLLSDDPNFSTIRKAFKGKLPFKTSEEIDEMITLRDSFAFSFNSPIKSFTLNELQGYLESLNIKIPKFVQSKMSGFSNLETTLFFGKKNIEDEIQKAKLIRAHYKTAIEIGKVISGFPLYISNMFCVRLRLYPNEYLVSRTAGKVKHLMCDYTPLKITQQGLIHLFKAYYSFSPDLLRKFNKYIKNISLSKKRGKDLLYAFFDDNQINFTQAKDPLYVMLLYSELQKVRKTNFTSVNIEIDQTASGMVFLSYLLQNKELAEHCNLLNDIKTSPYLYCMEMFKTFYYSKNKDGKPYFPDDIKNEKVFKFLTTNRKVHKFALMCYCYSQGNFGRGFDLEDRFKEEFRKPPTFEESVVLNRFAFNFDSFIDFCFKDLNKNKKKLERIVTSVLDESQKTAIFTLEGEKIEWQFFETTRKVRKFLNLKTNESKSFAVNVPVMNIDINGDSEDVLKISKRKHQKNFISYLIHSIDAAVMRIILRKMYEKTGYRVNHLHDCVILHPNYADDFFKVIVEIYTGNDMHNLAKKCVLDGLLESVSIDTRNEVIEKFEKFLESTTPFKVTKKTLIPSNLYRYES